MPANESKVMMETGNAAEISGTASLIQSADDLRSLLGLTLGWIQSHYLNILIACAIGAIIIMVLYGLRMLGARLCRREHLGHMALRVAALRLALQRRGRPSLAREVPMRCSGQ